MESALQSLEVVAFQLCRLNIIDASFSLYSLETTRIDMMKMRTTVVNKQLIDRATTLYCSAYEWCWRLK